MYNNIVVHDIPHEMPHERAELTIPFCENMIVKLGVGVRKNRVVTVIRDGTAWNKGVRPDDIIEVIDDQVKPQAVKKSLAALLDKNSGSCFHTHRKKHKDIIKQIKTSKRPVKITFRRV